MSVLMNECVLHKETLLTKAAAACLTLNHTRKMENHFSMNGDLQNSFCDHMRKNPYSICFNCYVPALPWYKSLLKKYTAAVILQRVIIPVEEMPLIYGFSEGRFNAFSELHNVTETINFLNFTIKNSHIDFGLWSKRPELIKAAFDKTGYKKPENLNIVYSDPIINGSDNALEIMNKYYIDGVRMIDRVFIVVTLDYAVKHEIKINCCRKCNACKDSCYTVCNADIVYELLKCDQKKGMKAGKYQ